MVLFPHMLDIFHRCPCNIDLTESKHTILMNSIKMIKGWDNIVVILREWHSPTALSWFRRIFLAPTHCDGADLTLFCLVVASRVRCVFVQKPVCSFLGFLWGMICDFPSRLSSPVIFYESFQRTPCWKISFSGSSVNFHLKPFFFQMRIAKTAAYLFCFSVPFLVNSLARCTWVDLGQW